MALNNEFIHLFYCLSDSERKMFTLYVNKNYSSKEKNINTLQYLKTTNGRIENYQKDKLIKKLKLKSTDSKTIGNQMSELYSKCQEWLLLESFRANDIDAKSLLLRIMNRRDFREKSYKKWNKKVAQSLSKASYRDINHHYLSWQQIHLSIFRASKKQLEDDTKEQLLNKAEDELDSFYALAKLRYYYERIIIARLKNTAYNSFSLEDANSFSKKHLSDISPLICYFANIIQAELTNDNSFYHVALEILSTNDQQIPPSELPTYYTCLSNYASKKFNEENGKQRIFNLQVLGLERDWITGGGQIAINLFLNLVNTGCLLGEISLVKNIIQDYGSKLPKEQQESCLATAEARVLFHENKFEEARDKLLLTPWDFELASLHIQSLLIRCCYEIGADELNTAKTYCINFKRNIDNSKTLSKELKLRFLSFIKISLMFFHKSPNWEKILLEIQQTERIICKDWLLEKVNNELI